MSKNINRCSWCTYSDIYIKYHDEEWGKEIKDDRILFEFFVLESAQAGLSWLTILKRREAYRKLYANFNVQKVANFSEEDIDRMTKDPSIIRHRGKIASSVKNAQIFMAIQSEFGSFYNYLYSFMPHNKPINNSIGTTKELIVTSKESDAIAKDLKKRGVKFFGSTICYAFMQAVGMVNDHSTTCSFK